MILDFDFSSEETVPCKIRDGWDESGKTGQYFGNMMINNKLWAIVLWDKEEDPDFFKAEGLLISAKRWISIAR